MRPSRPSFVYTLLSTACNLFNYPIFGAIPSSILRRLALGLTAE